MRRVSLGRKAAGLDDTLRKALFAPTRFPVGINAALTCRAINSRTKSWTDSRIPTRDAGRQ